MGKKLEIVLTTDVLTKTDVEKLTKRLKSDALDSLEHMLSETIYDEVHKKVKSMTKTVLKELDVQIRAEVKAEAPKSIKEMAIRLEWDY